MCLLISRLFSVFRVVSISLRAYFQMLKCVKCYKAMENSDMLLKCEYQITKKNRKINMVKSCLEHYFSRHLTINENNISTHTVLICFFCQSLASCQKNIVIHYEGTKWFTWPSFSPTLFFDQKYPVFVRLMLLKHCQ